MIHCVTVVRKLESIFGRKHRLEQVFMCHHSVPQVTNRVVHLDCGVDAGEFCHLPFVSNYFAAEPVDLKKRRNSK